MIQGQDGNRKEHEGDQIEPGGVHLSGFPPFKAKQVVTEFGFGTHSDVQ